MKTANQLMDGFGVYSRNPETRTLVAYLETKPSKEVIIKQINELEEKISIIQQRADAVYKSRKSYIDFYIHQFSEEKRMDLMNKEIAKLDKNIQEMKKEYGMPKLKKQLKTLKYIHE